MAKKQDKKVRFDPAVTSKAIETQINAVRSQLGQRSLYIASEHDKRTFGLAAPSGVCGLPLGYLIGSNVLPMQRVMQVAGESSTFKSSECFEYIRWILAQGGKAIIIENENKLSSSMLKAQLGPLMDLCIIKQTRSLEEVHATCTTECKTVSEALNQGVVLPTLVLIDSLSGKNTMAVDEDIQKEGHAKGRSFGAAVAANQNTEYFRTLGDMLAGLPILVIFTNHRKIDMQNPSPNPMIKNWKTPGGAATKFHSTLQLANETGSSYIKNLMTSDAQGIEGVCIKLVTDKCGMGPDDRKVDVPVLWTFDAEGQQHLWWDWNAATAFLLKKILDNKDKNFTFYAKRLSEALNLEVEKNRWSSKALKLDGVLPSQVGEALALPENDEILRNVEKVFGISRFAKFQEFEYD